MCTAHGHSFLPSVQCSQTLIFARWQFTFTMKPRYTASPCTTTTRGTPFYIDGLKLSLPCSRKSLLHGRYQGTSTCRYPMQWCLLAKGERVTVWQPRLLSGSWTSNSSQLHVAMTDACCIVLYTMTPALNLIGPRVVPPLWGSVAEKCDYSVYHHSLRQSTNTHNPIKVP